MHNLKKLMFLLVTLALLCTSAPIAKAQDGATADGTANRTVFLPMVTSGDNSAQLAEGDSAVESAQARLVVSRSVTDRNQKAALNFWTHEALAAAQPMAIAAQAGPAVVDTAALAQAQISGPHGFVASGFAAADADAAAQKAYPADWAALEAEAADDSVTAAANGGEPTGTSEVYTSYVVNQVSALWKLYPHRWIGRLSFSTPGGTSYCSATSISNNVMLTAAHCLYDTTNNNWYSNWVFSPAYRNGKAPYGTFPAATCWVLTAWVNLSGSYSINSWAQHDVGVCTMNKNSAGKTLNAAVGWMGREWNYSYIRHVHNMGYPFNNYNNNSLPNAGKYLRTCIAETYQQATEVRGMGCDLGGGISGGPWITGYAPNIVTGWATGVNSGIFIGSQNIFSGRFNSNNIVPLCNSAGC